MSQNIFLTVKANVAIEEVIGQYVTLKRAGIYWKGRCPFHQEKTASFTVSPHIQIFHCFGCHESGDVMAFVAKIENCSSFEAACQLAERYNIDISEHLKEPVQKNSSYYDACAFFALWTEKQLKQDTLARQYLHNRMIEEKVVTHFKVGYMPGGLHVIKNLLNDARKEHILSDDLIHAGIIMQGKSVLFSPFEERIIFPIADHAGRICGFGGRIYKENDTRAKYYNSKDSEQFSKGTLLFGLDKAKKAIQEKGFVFLVEGYTDCLAMAQAGFTNVVATLGTACSLTHLNLLARYANEIFIMYDGDSAGQQAILRIAQMCWKSNLEPSVILLPEKHDPASLLKSGYPIQDLVAKREDIFSFEIKKISEHFITLPLDQKLQLITHIIEIIKTVEDPIKQNILINKAAEKLNLKADLLRTEIKKSHQQKSLPIITKKPKTEQTDQFKTEKRIFSAIITNPLLLEKPSIELLFTYLPITLKNILVSLKKWLSTHVGPVNFSLFFNSLHEDDQKAISSLLFSHEQPVDEATFDTLINQLKKKWWKLIAQRIKIQVLEAKRLGDQEKVNILLKDFVLLQGKMLTQEIKKENDFN